MKDRTEYEIRVGCHLRGPAIPGHRKREPLGVVEKIDGSVVWLRTLSGVRMLHGVECEVLTMPAKRVLWPQWARRLAMDAVFSQKPVARRRR